MSKAVKAITGVIVILVVATAAYYVINDTSYLNGLNLFGRYQIPATISMGFYRNYTFNSSLPTNETFDFYLTPPSTNQFQHAQISVTDSTNVNESYVTNHNRTYLQMVVHPGNSFVDFQYNITTFGKSWHYLENSTAGPSQIPGYLKTQYDHPEWFNYSNGNYEVINPSLFKSLTLNLTQNYSSVIGKLRAIYNYIVANYRYNITYNIGNVPLTAQQVYEKGIGDCEELSYLFESMSRSIGIPSWTQYGLLVQSENGQVSVGEHAWVQTYIPSTNGTGQFVNIDLTVEVGGQNLGRGFLVKYPYAVIEWTDNGNSTDMVSYHNFLIYPSNARSIYSSYSYSVQYFKETGQITLSNPNPFSLQMADFHND